MREAAAQGDAAALGALRRHQRRYRTAIDAAVKSDKTGAPAAEIAAEFRPEVRANGDVVYRLRDGGRVVDGSTGVHIEKQSHIAIALALSLQAERTAGRQVSVCDPELATPSIAVAARERLDLIFDIPEHEVERRRLLTLFERQDGALAAAVLIKQRNARAAQDGSPLHRIWGDGDAGEASVQAIEIENGTHLLLLREGDAVLVKPLTATEAQTLQGLEPRDKVQLSPQGEILKGPQR